MKATARVQCQQSEAKTTEVEGCMATYVWFVTDFQSQTAHNSANYGWWLKLLIRDDSCINRTINARDTAHVFSMKLSAYSSHGQFSLGS